MRSPTEHIKTLQRRVDFLKAREHQNSFDLAELGSLEWAIVNLQPKREWAGLTEGERAQFSRWVHIEIIERIEANLKERNA